MGSAQQGNRSAGYNVDPQAAVERERRQKEAARQDRHATMQDAKGRRV